MARPLSKRQSSKRPVSKRPNGHQPVSADVRAAAGLMLAELDGQKLEVMKLRTNDSRGGYVRAVICPNPEWYSRLCEQFLAARFSRRWRRPRTQIRRQDVRRTLASLSQGVRGSGVYFDRVLEILDWWQQQSDRSIVPAAVPVENDHAEF